MERVILIGAEAVEVAGHRIARAAEEMSRAAGRIDDSVTRLQQILDTHLAELRELRMEALGITERDLADTMPDRPGG